MIFLNDTLLPHVKIELVYTLKVLFVNNMYNNIRIYISDDIFFVHNS